MEQKLNIPRLLSLFVMCCLLVSLLSVGGYADDGSENESLPAEEELAESDAPEAPGAPEADADDVQDDGSNQGSEAEEEPAGITEEIPAQENTADEMTPEEVPEETAPQEEAAEEAPEAEQPAADGAPGGPGGGSSSSVTWSGATTITSATTQTGKTYTSTTASQNALLVNTSGAVAINDPTVTKSGGTSAGDSESFYGTNAAVMVKGGSTTTINGGAIKTSAAGANGVFSYGGNGGRNGAAGDGTKVVIRNTTITTTGGGSGGIMTTGGGITYAYDLNIHTSGQSSAPIRTDRGGGTVVVDGGYYESNGLGSPVIYSTASVTVKNATLVSTKSEGVCIEGKNSITLENCDFTVTNTTMNGNAKFLDSIMIYQSMSGDADSGSSYFTMTGGSLTSNSGHVFHVTNTTAVINLSGVKITNNHSSTAYKTLISVCDDGWSGAKNIATINADAQTLSGGILVGSNSTLTLNLKNGSTYTGYFYGVITNYKGTTVSTSLGTVNVTLDSTSKLYLEADADISSFSGNPANVITNGHTLYVNGKALAGTTDYEETGSLDYNGDGTVNAADAAAALAAGTQNAVWDAVTILKMTVGLSA